MAARSSSSSDYAESSHMAAPSSSSSDYASNPTGEKLVALDSLDNGPSEAERYSFMGELNHSLKVIISGTADFDETIDGKVVTTNNLDAESCHIDMAGIENLESKSLSEMDGVGAALIECECCYWEFQLENLIQCPTGHRLCFSCIRRQVEEIIYGGLKAHGTLSCMAIDNCNESIPLSEIQRALPNDVIERYEDRQAQQAVAEAKIEGLVYCPFCQIPYEVDKCVKVLNCPNFKCLKASCIQCKKLSHLPLRCDDVEKKSENVTLEATLRTEVEERMTKAVIRECNICQAKLIKVGGCNEMTCRCGNRMCYVCRENLQDFDKEHFCQCDKYSAGPGKPCPNCNRCSSVENEVEENEALAAKEEALKELVEKEPKLLDMEIGPPLKWLRRQQLSPRPQFRYVAVNPRSPPQEFFRRGDQLENVGPPPHQLENMAIPPQLRPPVHFEFGDADQLQQFFPHDDQLANMHSHLQPEQVYGRHLQPQEDYGRHLHLQSQQGYGRHLQAQEDYGPHLHLQSQQGYGRPLQPQQDYGRRLHLQTEQGYGRPLQGQGDHGRRLHLQAEQGYGRRLQAQGDHGRHLHLQAEKGYGRRLQAQGDHRQHQHLQAEQGYGRCLQAQGEHGRHLHLQAEQGYGRRLQAQGDHRQHQHLQAEQGYGRCLQAKQGYRRCLQAQGDHGRNLHLQAEQGYGRRLQAQGDHGRHLHVQTKQGYVRRLQAQGNHGQHLHLQAEQRYGRCLQGQGDHGRHLHLQAEQGYGRPLQAQGDHGQHQHLQAEQVYGRCLQAQGDHGRHLHLQAEQGYGRHLQAQGDHGRHLHLHDEQGYRRGYGRHLHLEADQGYRRYLQAEQGHGGH